MLSINAQTKMCLLLGDPVDHSLSPLLHNTAYKALGMNYVYLASRVEEEMVGEAVSGLRALSAAGANVTSPHKEAVIPYLDSVTEEASSISSVNTIVNRNGHLDGSSTDGAGFYQALKHSAPDYDIKQPLLVIGAGGAARAIAFTMAGSGSNEILIANRSIGKAEKLADLINKKTGIKKCSALSLDDDRLVEEIKRFRLFIYTLPTDLERFIALLCKSGISFSKSICVDLRYSPAESAVLKQFKQLGGRSFNGLGMLLWQAIIAFEEITGRKAPVNEMQRVVKY
ncbi:MAG: shikimate dehydrogenase [Bacillota bacterium]